MMQAVFAKLGWALYWVLWIAYAIAYMAAFFEGVHHWLEWGIGGAIGVFVATWFLGPLSAIACTAIAFYGALEGWQWPWWQVVLLIFPFPILAVLAGGAEWVVSLVAAFRARLARRRFRCEHCGQYSHAFRSSRRHCSPSCLQQAYLKRVAAAGPGGPGPARTFFGRPAVISWAYQSRWGKVKPMMGIVLILVLVGSWVVFLAGVLELDA
jgi:hypothetical protein